MVKFCSKCKKILPIEAVFCPTCGGQNLLQFCQNCKKIVPNGIKTCPTCGSSEATQIAMHQKEISRPPKKKKWRVFLAFLLLAVVIGGFFSYKNDIFHDLFMTDEKKEKSQPPMNTTPIVSESDIVGFWDGGKINDGNHTQYLYFSENGVYWIAEKSGTPTVSQLNSNSDYRIATNYSISVDSVGDTICVFGDWTATISSINRMSVSGRTISGSYKKFSEPTPSIGSDYSDESKAPTPTTGERNALEEAKSYLATMPFSYSGLIEQLEYVGYSKSEAVYGADNCGANWNEQAAKEAKSYLDIMPFSRSRLIEQLEYVGFTHEQAVYGVEQNGY